MTELENLKSLERYDQWKKAKQSRTRWIKFMAYLIGTLLGVLLTWAILQIGIGSVWTLTKGAFASEEKIMEYVPKIEQIDNKLKKSIVKKPLNWVSKKYEEQVAKEVLQGNFSAIVSGIRVYCWILIGVWLVVWGLINTIFSLLAYWIISSFIWKEPTLYEQEI